MSKKSSERYMARINSQKPRKQVKQKPASNDTTPDWTHNCEICGQTPIVPATGMCGPCTFGEADTMGGNW